jgi:hypothetical protein
MFKAILRGLLTKMSKWFTVFTQRLSLIRDSPSEKVQLILFIFTDDFLAVFKKVQNQPMFTWVPALVDGYNKDDCLNIDEGRSIDNMRRLTMIQNERARNEAEKLGFTS